MVRVVLRHLSGILAICFVVISLPISASADMLASEAPVLIEEGPPGVDPTKPDPALAAMMAIAAAMAYVPFEGSEKANAGKTSEDKKDAAQRDGVENAQGQSSAIERNTRQVTDRVQTQLDFWAEEFYDLPDDLREQILALAPFFFNLSEEDQLALLGQAFMFFETSEFIQEGLLEYAKYVLLLPTRDREKLLEYLPDFFNASEPVQEGLLEYAGEFLGLRPEDHHLGRWRSPTRDDQRMRDQLYGQADAFFDATDSVQQGLLTYAEQFFDGDETWLPKKYRVLVIKKAKGFFEMDRKTQLETLDIPQADADRVDDHPHHMLPQLDDALYGLDLDNGVILEVKP